ncbi:MAG: hypothetical protein M3173_04255 [Chloroflexota bacterium]|nr:hypothetical protein [Chloroflexota bacterium]
MNHRQPTDETLSDQPISSQPHSSQHFEDRGTTDTIGRDAGNDPRAARARRRNRTEDIDPVRERVEEEGAHDESAARKTAKTVGMATGIFFTVVILTIVAAVLILWLVLS